MLCKGLTARRFLKIRKDAIINWVKLDDNDDTRNTRRELKACDRRLRSLATDQRLASEQQHLNDMYEALSARPPEMAIVLMR